MSSKTYHKTYYQRHREEKLSYARAYRQRHTKEERATYMREWRRRNPEKARVLGQRHYQRHSERYKAQAKAWQHKVRADALAAYGSRCACCEEGRIEFLVIDHINGGGNAHRRKVGGGGYWTYIWLRRNGYPRSFQVLCYNCNSALGAYGYCPHQLPQ